YKSHLQKGITKGALTQEQADEKFQQWLETKENKIEEKKKRVAGASVKEMEARLAEETKKKEAIAEAIRAKNTPPPVEEVPEPASENTAAAADENIAEGNAAENPSDTSPAE